MRRVSQREKCRGEGAPSGTKDWGGEREKICGWARVSMFIYCDGPREY